MTPIPDLALQFAVVFHGLDRAYGIYRTDGAVSEKGKATGGGQTFKGAVTNALWEAHLAGKQRLGIIPVTDNATARFGAIDVDRYDLDLNDVEAKIQRLALPLILCRSKSGGAHLYLFTREPVEARLIRDKLTAWAIVMGFPGVEIFPKQVKLANDSDVGNWINMPYFDAELTTTYAIQDGKMLSAERFLALIGERSLTGEQLREADADLPNIPDGAPPCLKVLAANGVPEGQRNNAIFNFGVLARIMNAENPDGQAWEADLARFNDDFIMPPLPFRELAATVKSLSTKNYFYACANEPIASICDKSTCRKMAYGVGGDGPEDPGVLIDRVIKVMTDPPTWIFCIAGVNIEMETDDFLIQGRFKRKVAEKLNLIPSSLKQPKWEKLINELLANVIEENAPEDASSYGQFLTHLYDFCNRQSRGETQESLLIYGMYHNEDEGRIYFRSTYLEKYLEQQKFREHNGKSLWKALRKIEGIQHGQDNIKGRNVQWWSIPEANLTTEDYTVPRVPEEEF